MVCAAKGYPFVAVMAESFSVERRKLMRMLGAKVILTPAAERGSGMVRKAEELAKKHGWFLARQFENPANPEYHRNTTGPGDPARLRGQAARLLGDRLGHRRHAHRRGRDASRRRGPTSRSSSPSRRARRCSPAREWKPHKIQGWTPDFVPAVLDREVYDEVVTVDRRRGDRDAARDLAAKEGIFCGISSGGTFAAALKVAQKAPKGSVILAMLPDTGERYLSTILFEGISDASDAEPLNGLGVSGQR